jgi:hypothetical protein
MFLMKANQWLQWSVGLAVAAVLSGPVNASAAPDGQPSAKGECKGGGKHRMGHMKHKLGRILTAEEHEKLKGVREQVMAANPALKTELDALISERRELGRDATKEEREEFRAKMKAFHEKIQAAMLAADPSVKPILDKIAAARAEHKKA